MWWLTPVIAALRRLRQGDSECKASLHHIVISRPAKSTVWNLSPKKKYIFPPIVVFILCRFFFLSLSWPSMFSQLKIFPQPTHKTFGLKGWITANNNSQRFPSLEGKWKAHSSESCLPYPILSWGGGRASYGAKWPASPDALGSVWFMSILFTAEELLIIYYTWSHVYITHLGQRQGLCPEACIC